MVRVRQEAERLILEEPEKFFLPKGNLIVEEDEYREMLNIKRKPNDSN